MHERVPYIKLSAGAFITLNNNIILANGNHETIAKRICNNLSPANQKLFELWKDSKYISEEDFLVCVLLYDKVENVLNRSITTASPRPYERLYNYYLMDWDIIRQKPIIYNEEKKAFEKLHTGWEYSDQIDLEDKYEIEEIKKNVPFEDRYLFLKK